MIETKGCQCQCDYRFLILKLTMIGERGGPTVYFVLQLLLRWRDDDTADAI